MKMNNDIVVKNWLDLQKLLFENSWDEGIQRYRSPYAFRGLSLKDYELKTTLIRLGGRFELMEKHLLRNFRKYSPKGTLSSDLIWDWLAVAQHHGLSTRLLDWTYSPYVAMHFVTANQLHYDQDGAVWCVNFMKSNELLPAQLNSTLFDESSNVFTGEMLGRNCKSLADLEKLKDNNEDFVLFLEPPSFDDRIVNQFALFSLFSNPKSQLDYWLEDHPDLYYRIIIPAKLKWEIRDKLDQVNITERVLFPGLDGLSAWLRRYYGPGK
ncbi:MAG: FRG domain-containing protein [Methanococcaceae archaeon]